MRWHRWHWSDTNTHCYLWSGPQTGPLVCGAYKDKQIATPSSVISFSGPLVWSSPGGVVVLVRYPCLEILLYTDHRRYHLINLGLKVWSTVYIDNRFRSILISCESNELKVISKVSYHITFRFEKSRSSLRYIWYFLIVTWQVHQTQWRGSGSFRTPIISTPLSLYNYTNMD